MVRLYLQLNFRQARLQGLWEEYLAALDLCDGRTALDVYWASDARRALTGRMPPEWLELVEEEFYRRRDG